MRLKLNRALITDPDLNKSFDLLEDFINNQTFIKGEFKFFEIVIPAAVTNYKYSHKLGFAPKDVLMTSVVGASPTWNYSLFDSTFLNITVAGSSTIRAFVGRYGES